MPVYFIRPIGIPDAPVKIGCSEDPALRLKTLGVWSPFPLEIAATVDGDQTLERRIHGIFAAQHSHHEWFRASPELDAMIARLAAGEPLAAIIDLQAPVKPFRARSVAYMTPEWRRRTSYNSRLRCAFQKLRATGTERWDEPDDVEQIMTAWGRYSDTVTPPTAEQLQRLEEVIADPATHAVVPSWIREKAAA